jgi:tRNA/rRNA methyltransferase
MTRSPIVILVETMGPANLGAVARCCAAFGVTDLRLAEPLCEPDETTLMWACYGKRALEGMRVFPTLEQALTGVGLAVAFTRRDGKRRHRHHSLAQLCQQVLPQYQTEAPLALVFGNEESGLSNAHLSACQLSAEIPVLASDGSLNLSHAVAVGLYEVVGREREVMPPEPKSEHEMPADGEDLERLVERCSSTLAMAGYPHHRGVLEDEVSKLKNIVMRGGLKDWEVRLLLGMLKQVRYRLSHPGQERAATDSERALYGPEGGAK